MGSFSSGSSCCWNSTWSNLSLIVSHHRQMCYKKTSCEMAVGHPPFWELSWKANFTEAHFCMFYLPRQLTFVRPLIFSKYRLLSLRYALKKTMGRCFASYWNTLKLWWLKKLCRLQNAMVRAPLKLMAVSFSTKFFSYTDPFFTEKPQLHLKPGNCTY